MTLRKTLGLLLVLALFSTAYAQKTIDMPNAGRLQFGPVGGVTNQAGAMGKLLAAVHQSCGERPQLGRTLRLRGTDAVAVFFTATKRTQNNLRIAGVVIAANSGDHIEAALVSDEASRFNRTLNPMMARLFKEWHPAPAPVSAQGGPSAPPLPLRRVMSQDRSVWASVPDGWKFQGSSGTAAVFGPHNEKVGLNQTISAINTDDRQQQMFERQSHAYGGRPYMPTSLRMPLHVPVTGAVQPALEFYWRSNRIAYSNLKLAPAQLISASQAQRCAYASGQVTVQGVANELHVLACQHSLNSGLYLIGLTFSAVPAPQANQERATVSAIMSSYGVDQQIVARQANAIAAPAVDAIHQLGERTRSAAAQQSAMWDDYRANHAKNEDSRDKRYQAFDNFIRDETVVLDKEQNAHGTTWTATADSLVRNNPDRYEIVDTPNFWKGVDY